MGSDAGAGWQGDVPPPTEPPPTPFERAAAPAAPPAPTGPSSDGSGSAVPGRPRRRRRVALLVGAAAVLVVAGVVLLAGRAGDGTSDGRDADAAADVASGPRDDAELLVVLEAVDAAELAMLGFDEAAGAAFEDAASEEEALALVVAAAGTAVTELRGGRTGLVDPLDSAPAEAVRAAYVPHLDAWVAYLSAVAEDPLVLFGEGSEPLILRINATAGVFAAALEEVVDAGVGPEVERAARAILERGFPAQDDAQL